MLIECNIKLDCKLRFFNPHISYTIHLYADLVHAMQLKKQEKNAL